MSPQRMEKWKNMQHTGMNGKVFFVLFLSMCDCSSIKHNFSVNGELYDPFSCLIWESQSLIINIPYLHSFKCFIHLCFHTTVYLTKVHSDGLKLNNYWAKMFSRRRRSYLKLPKQARWTECVFFGRATLPSIIEKEKCGWSADTCSESKEAESYNWTLSDKKKRLSSYSTAVQNHTFDFVCFYQGFDLKCNQFKSAWHEC